MGTNSKTMRGAIALALTCMLTWRTCEAGTYQTGVTHDKVVGLTTMSFNAAINDPANPLWFLKFYAPWCGHCKRMAPVLDEVAPLLHGKMAIGKVDCTNEKRLCDRFKIRGYPSLKFALDGDLHEYPGSRDQKSIINFANKMSAPAVKPVATYEAAIEFAKEHTDEGVVFVGYDASTFNEAVDIEESMQSTTYGQVFAQVARKQKAFAHFLWLDLAADAENADEILGPFATVAVEDVATKFINRLEDGIAPRAYLSEEESDEEKAEITTSDLEEFIATQSIATITTIGPANFQKIGKSGRPLVVGIVDFKDESQVNEAKAELTKYVTSDGPADIVDKYYFGMMDGVRWKKFLEQFRVHQIPQYIVLDVPTKNFYQNETYTKLEDFLEAVHDRSIPRENAKALKRGGFLGKIEGIFIDNLPYSLLVALLLVFAFVYMLVPPSEGLEPSMDDNIHEDLLFEEEVRKNSQAQAPAAQDASPAQEAESKKDK